MHPDFCFIRHFPLLIIWGFACLPLLNINLIFAYGISQRTQTPPSVVVITYLKLHLNKYKEAFFLPINIILYLILNFFHHLLPNCSVLRGHPASHHKSLLVCIICWFMTSLFTSFLKHSKYKVAQKWTSNLGEHLRVTRCHSENGKLPIHSLSWFLKIFFQLHMDIWESLLYLMLAFFSVF